MSQCHFRYHKFQTKILRTQSRPPRGQTGYGTTREASPVILAKLTKPMAISGCRNIRFLEPHMCAAKIYYFQSRDRSSTQ